MAKCAIKILRHIYPEVGTFGIYDLWIAPGKRHINPEKGTLNPEKGTIGVTKKTLETRINKAF